VRPPLASESVESRSDTYREGRLVVAYFSRAPAGSRSSERQRRGVEGEWKAAKCEPAPIGSAACACIIKIKPRAISSMDIARWRMHEPGVLERTRVRLDSLNAGIMRELPMLQHIFAARSFVGAMCSRNDTHPAALPRLLAAPEAVASCKPY
jgi:hypothetical protein